MMTAAPLFTSCNKAKTADSGKWTTKTELPVAASPAAHAATPLPAMRLLTEREQGVLALVFSEEFDLSNIRIRHQQNAAGITTQGNMIICGRDAYSADFVHERDPARFCSLFREAMSLWQDCQGMMKTAADTQDVYTPDAQLTLLDYTPRQQQAIVEDYMARFIHQSRQTKWIYAAYGYDTHETDKALITLVETQFPLAQKLREANAGIITRDLTDHERAFVEFFFKDEIDTKHIRNSFYPQKYSDEGGTTLAFVCDPQTVNLWKQKSFSVNFALETDIEKFSTFIHEITHIWQFQNNAPNIHKEDGEYRYRLDGQSFMDYGAEQQAAIIEDYARYVLRQGAQMRWLPQVYVGNQLIQKREEMCNMVETRFPHLKPVRLETERLRKQDPNMVFEITFKAMPQPASP